MRRQGQELLDHLLEAAKRMRKLIDDLLSFSQVSDGRLMPGVSVDANVQMEMAIENLEGVIHETGATVTHDTLPVVRVNATSLIQVFQNLISNGIHYRGLDAPRIHVGAVDRDTEWLFSCRDNGIGIAPEFQTRIFEPFKRLHGADRPGTGLGLAVCKRIVERYGGRIWVESEVQRGSTFLFTLRKA